MGLHLRSAGQWAKEQFAFSIWVGALWASLLSTSISFAGEIKELLVDEADGEYRLRIVSVLDAPAEHVYYVITDYKNACRISSSIIDVEILPSYRDKVIRLRNLSEHKLGPFYFKTNWVGDIVETKRGFIKVETIPELSSYESGSASWEIRPWGKRTQVIHESSLKPKFFIPPVIGKYFIKIRIEDLALATFKNIECEAKYMSETDMEPEHFEYFFEERKLCTDTQH